jgi:hypothetical protein
MGIDLSGQFKTLAEIQRHLGFFSQFVEISRRARMEVFPANNRIGFTPSDPGVAVWRSDNSRS